MSEAAAPGADALQFDKAEFEAPAQAACASCKRPLQEVYYSLNGKAICTRCRDAVLNRPAATTRGLVRGGLRGLGTALVCGLVWGVITTASGYNLGIVSVFVGFFIGREVIRGSKQNGWPYQLLAIGLSYLSIVVSYIPEIYQAMQSHGHDPTTLGADRLIAMAVFLPIVPLKMSFSHPLSGLIYGFALYQAWKVTRRVPIPFSGPLQVNRPGPVAEASPITGEPTVV